MSKLDEHSRLINGAARAILRPLGFQQKGQSRLWFADRGYWALIVEFQPSSFSKGSYLNICAMWLWVPADHWVFHYYERAGGFIAFENIEQFKPEAEQLVGLAAEEIMRLDRRFASHRDVAFYLQQEISERPASQNFYNTAIAAGLTEDWRLSRQCLETFLAEEDEHPFWKAVQADAKTLMGLIGDTTAFRGAIRERVARTRSALHLPELE